MHRAVVAFCLLLVLGACRSSPTATPTPSPTNLTRADLSSGVLTLSDMGAGWKEYTPAVSDKGPARTPAPDTFQVGGRVGTATYIRDALEQVTVAFAQRDGSGFVSNTVYTVRSIDAAQFVMAAHRDADTKTTWRQARVDGGSTTFKLNGRLPGLPTLGEDTYTARAEAKIEDKNGNVTNRKIEYVAYRIGNVLSFVVSQDVGVATFAKRQEARLARIIT